MNRVKRLKYLASMLSKYAHCWYKGPNGEPSSRMYAWVDEYNDIKAQHPQDFAAYCAETHASPAHDAYDCLA